MILLLVMLAVTPVAREFNSSTLCTVSAALKALFRIPAIITILNRSNSTENGMPVGQQPARPTGPFNL
jgi:hypothetical protein